MNYLESLLDTVQSIDLQDGSFLKIMAIICVAIFVLSLLGRTLCGKRSNLNHAVSSGIGILFLYILGILLYGTNNNFSGLLTSLPFVAVRDGNLALFSFQSAGFQAVCSELLRMMILAFLVNLLDTLLPKGKNLLMWLLFRLITVFLAVISQTVLVWVFTIFLPATFLAWAPVILVALLVFLLLLGALKLLVGVALAAVNPIIGALYTFFFSNLVGKQISKAVLTTLLLSAVVFIFNHMGYTVVYIVGIALTTLLPIIAVLLILWYLVNQIL